MFARSAAVLSLLLFVLLSPRFVWSQTPQITQVSPASGSSGTLVTITGSSFGSSQGTGSVSIGGAAAAVGTWSDIQITATVGSGAPTGSGNVVVTSGGSVQSNAFAFTVLPPNVFAGPVTYSYDELGRLVGAVAATGDAVKYSYDAVGNILGITRYSASQFAFFTFSPRSGPVGTSVTISGSNFSSNPAQDTVTFNGASATIGSASATQLIATVPSGATTGPLTISSPAGSVTTAESFIVTATGGAPRIDSFTPQIAASASSVVLAGANFDLLPANNRLVLNITPAAIPTGVTGTGMTMTVPAAAGSGHIALANPGGTTVSSGDLFVPPSPFTPAQVGYTGRTNLGVAATTSIATANKIGLLLFEGVAGHNVSVASSSATFSSCTFQIYKPDNMALSATTASCSSSSFLDSQRLPVTGTYALLINASTGSAGGATFTIYDSTEIAAALTPGGPPFTITTTAPGQNARLSFFGNQNQHVSITLSGSTFTNCSLYVYNPDSTVLVNATSCTASNTFVEVPYLPERGVYTILVDPGTTQTGALTVRLNDATDVTGTLTAGGSSVTATTTTVGQNATYTFAGTQNQHVSISILSSTFNNCYFQVLNPDGTALVSGTSAPCDHAKTFYDVPLLPQAGSYKLIVDPSTTETGTATIKLNDATDTTGAITADGTPVTVTTAVAGQNVRLTFSGTAGQVVSAAFDNNTFAASTTITLLNPSGGTVLTSSTGANASNFMYPDGYCSFGLAIYPCSTNSLPSAGTYTLFIDPQGATTGSMRIRLYTVPADQTASGTLGGSAIPISLNTPGQNARITFTGTQNHKVSIKLTNGTLAGTVAAGCNFDLVPPGGGLILGNQNCLLTSTFIDYGVLSQTGTYTAIVDPMGNVTGGITVQLYDDSDVSVPVAADGVSHTITTTIPGQNSFATFSGTNQQKIFAVVNGISGYTSPTVQLVRGTSNQLIANALQDGTTYDICGSSCVPFTLPATDSYAVFVNPSSSDIGSAVVTLYSVPADFSGSTDTAGTPVTATTTTPGQNAVLTFTANSGQSLTVNLTSGTYSTGHCQISIKRPDGAFLAAGQDCSGATHSFGPYSLTVTGTYTITIDPQYNATGQVAVAVTAH